MGCYHVIAVILIRDLILPRRFSSILVQVSHLQMPGDTQVGHDECLATKLYISVGATDFRVLSVPFILVYVLKCASIEFLSA